MRVKNDHRSQFSNFSYSCIRLQYHKIFISRQNKLACAQKASERIATFVPRWFHLLVDGKTVVFLVKISKEIGKAWRKGLTRAKRESLTRPQGMWGERKKNDCPFAIWVRSNQGVQKCRRAVKNLFSTPPSLWIWYTRWLISRKNSACYCLHLASNLPLYPVILKQFLALLLCEL